MATNNQDVNVLHSGAAKKQESVFSYMRKHWELYIIFIGPALLLTIIFRYLPMGGILIAFQKFNPIRGIVGSEWVGFKFFERFLSSPDFIRYLSNTLKLSAYGLVWGFPVPIILALLLNRIGSNTIKKKIQTILYIPNFVSVIVLSNASQELREAAELDGANIWQQIKAVDWPAIKDIVVIQFIMQAGNIMSIGFEKAYALQTDMNLKSSEIIATYVYKKGLLDGDYSFSTAVGLFNTVINVVLLIAINKIIAKMNDGKGI